MTERLEVRETPEVQEWRSGLRDLRAAAVIDRRLRRLSLGLLGDFKSVGGGVSELRVDVGPGYRLYFTRRGPRVILLLCGGDKSSQARDIERARRLAEQYA